MGKSFRVHSTSPTHSRKPWQTERALQLVTTIVAPSKVERVLTLVGVGGGGKRGYQTSQ